MQRKWSGLMSVALLAVLPVAPAAAQGIVYDPTNHVQNMLQAARALEQIHNQVAQIENQTRMLARNPLQLSGELSASIAEARELFKAGEGLAFELDRVGDDMRALYPETWEKFGLADIVARSEQWIHEDRASLERALRAEAQAARAVDAARGRLESALSGSAGAEGQTSAIQAGNQLLGVTATQLAEIQALLAAQSRALTTERLERIAREERSMEIQRRAFPTTSSRTFKPARSAF